MRLDPLRNLMGADFLALLLLVLMGATLFRVHLLGVGTFIGDSDRLNTFLNIRTFEVESIKHGWSMEWDPFMYMGFDTSGLHYTFVGADPIAHFEAMFPARQLFRVAGYVSCIFLIAAAWAAYLFIKDTTHHVFAAFVGAVLYSLSAFSVVRISQVDPAFAVLICIPLGLLILRRLRGDNTALCFFLSALLLSVLLLFSFLQEAAYAIILFGAYGAYKSLMSKSWRSLGLFLAALGVAATISFPRLFTVIQDFLLLDRTTTLNGTCWCEISRWFNDGVFGRFPQEAAALGNGVNLHEGIQLYTSAFTALLVLAGVLCFRGLLGSFATASFLTALGWILVPWVGAVRSIALVILMLLGYLAVVRAGRRVPGGTDWHFEEADAPFHLFFLTVALGVVLIEPVRYLFYLAFLRIDFTHSRISGTALLSMCTLASVFLRELLSTSGSRPSGRAWAILLCGSVALALGVLWLIGNLAHGPLMGRLGLIISLLLGSRIKALPVELIKVFWTIIAFVVFLIAIWVGSVAGKVYVRQILALSLGFMMIFQAFQYADFQLFGPHTWTFPIPFLDNNFLNVRPTVLRPPSVSAVQAFHQRLDVDNFRSVLVANPRNFPAFVAPHISQFWRLRLVEGYGPGVPRRLAMLPWPDGVRTFRALSFADTAHLPWPLLSILNVKYAMVVDRALYYNLGQAGSEATPRDEQILTNPLPVVPRAFFVGTVLPVHSASRGSTRAVLPPSGIYPTVVSSDRIKLSWTGVTTNARYDIFRKEGEGGSYVRAGGTGPDGSAHLSTGLKPETPYYFRVRACTRARCSAYSSSVEATTAAEGLTPPTELKAAAVSSRVVLLSWSAGTGHERFRIERKEGQREGYLEIHETDPGTHSYRASGLKSLTTYYFRVRACTARSCSPHSAEVAAAVPSSLRFSELGSVLPSRPAVESSVEGIPGPAQFSTTGRIRVHYAGARVDIYVDPSTRPRFLVLNELYHPGWKAFAGGTALQIYPTNVVMQGLVVPPGVTRVNLRFVPFLHTFAGALILACGVVLLGVGWRVFRRFEVGR